MKRLSFEHERKSVHETTRSPASVFSRMKEAALVGAALLGLGGCASAAAIAPPTLARTEYRAVGADSAASPRSTVDSSLLYARTTHKDAVSPNATTIEIAGRTLNVIRLDTRLADLNTQTSQYRMPEEIPTQTGGRYSNEVLIPGEVRFIVTLNPNEGQRRVTIGFPTPGSETLSTGGIDISNFATLVQSVSGQEMVRVNFIVERGTFNNNGATTAYTNAYIFPLNAQGEVITRRGNGEFIVYAASYYTNTPGGTTSLLVEPNNRDSLYASR